MSKDQETIILNENEEEPREHICTTPELVEYILNMESFEKPLENELTILRYCKAMKDEIVIENMPTLFNPAEEANKIHSGYYLNIDEILNILRNCHDSVPNPFLKFHNSSEEYLNILKHENDNLYQDMRKSWQNFSSENFDFENFLHENETINLENNTINLENDIINLGNDTINLEDDTISQPRSQLSTFQVSDIDENEEVCNKKQKLNISIIENKIVTTKRAKQNKSNDNLSIKKNRVEQVELVKNIFAIKGKPKINSEILTKQCDKRNKSKGNMIIKKSR